ncbi:hypothetical protein DF268_42480 [Streptomyces sp. V2]|nr:hypothetical protein DF268_42480 [Streptomyces sp. V2]
MTVPNETVRAGDQLIQPPPPSRGYRSAGCVWIGVGGLLVVAGWRWLRFVPRPCRMQRSATVGEGVFGCFLPRYVSKPQVSVATRLLSCGSVPTTTASGTRVGSY